MITAIDKNTALVLIDLQKGILKNQLAHPVSEVLAKVSALISAFRAQRLPVVIVNVSPGGAWIDTRKDSPAVRNTANAAAASPDFTEIVDEINTDPADIFITKQTWNAFYNTPLHDELKKRGVTGIVLGGVSTSIGVEGSARAAAERGYNIAFAIDAMTDMNAEAHQHSIKNIFPRIGESGTVKEIVDKLSVRV
jgi:nicotinamidase-related amidase